MYVIVVYQTDLVLLELGSDTPALVIRQCMTVFLEEGVDARDTSVPAVLKILQSETPTTDI
jgi:hypothetical protein